MKTKTLFAVAIIAFATNALLANMAAAVTKCVALDSSISCDDTTEYNQADWSTYCETSRGSVFIQGIAFCSNQNSGTQYSKSSTITTSSNATENRFCWCKLVSPAVSYWVYRFVFPTADVCSENCTAFCMSGFNISQSGQYKAAIFSNLSD